MNPTHQFYACTSIINHYRNHKLYQGVFHNAIQTADKNKHGHINFSPSLQKRDNTYIYERE